MRLGPADPTTGATLTFWALSRDQSLATTTKIFQSTLPLPLSNTRALMPTATVAIPFDINNDIPGMDNAFGTED